MIHRPVSAAVFAALTGLAMAASCGSVARPPTADSESDRAAPRGLEHHIVARRGALSYQSAFVGTRLWIATELTTRFELVVRRLDPQTASVLELGRVDLGPPDWDMTGLATASRGPIAWVSSRSGVVRAVDVAALKVVKEFRVGTAATAIDVSADGRRLAYGTDSGVLCLRRTSDGALLQCLIAHSGPITAMAFDGDELLSAGGGDVTRWSLPTLRVVSTRSLPAPVAAIAASRQGVAYALGPSDPRDKTPHAVVVEGANETRARCDGHEGPVTGVRWVGATLLSASRDGSVRLWRVQESARCHPIGVHRIGQPVQSLALPPSGAFVAIGLWADKLDQPSAVLARLLHEGRQGDD